MVLKKNMSLSRNSSESSLSSWQTRLYALKKSSDLYSELLGYKNDIQDQYSKRRRHWYYVRGLILFSVSPHGLLMSNTSLKGMREWGRFINAYLFFKWKLNKAEWKSYLTILLTTGCPRKHGIQYIVIFR